MTHIARRASAVALISISVAGLCLSAQKTVTIYPDKADAKAEIKSAIAQAKRSHKRVILDFGGNWCGDCVALDALFHKEPNASLLKRHFILVDVNIGRFDKNVDVAKQYEVPLEKGVPALAVIDGLGNVIYSQKNGEFEAMRTMDPTSVKTFLEKWKS
jgi:thiol:disulfide interchange protein